MGTSEQPRERGDTAACTGCRGASPLSQSKAQTNREFQQRLLAGARLRLVRL